MRKLLKGMVWAGTGIAYVVRTQRNMRIHLIAAVLVVMVCVYLNMPRHELSIVSLTIFLVLAAETFNTAVEAAVDLCTDQPHPLARVAKDAAAGAVLLCAVNALVVAYLLIWPRLIELAR